MIKGIIRGDYSSDVDLDSYVPEDEKVFGFPMDIFVGTEVDVGSDTFEIMVCSPEWLRIHYGDRQMFWGRHMLIVMKYDIKEIRKFIEATVSQYSGNTWLDVARKIGRFGHWEFEDYRPHSGAPPASETDEGS